MPKRRVDARRKKKKKRMSDESRNEIKKHGPFRIVIDDALFNLPDPFITGAELKALSEEALMTDAVWQEVSGGEDILVGDNDRVDLRKPGISGFYTGGKAKKRKSDASKNKKKKDVRFRILIEHERFNWPAPFITGAEIKAISDEALVTDEVWQEVSGGENIRIGDNEQVDLRKPGNESFYVARKTTTKD